MLHINAFFCRISPETMKIVLMEFLNKYFQPNLHRFHTLFINAALKQKSVHLHIAFCRCIICLKQIGATCKSLHSFSVLGALAELYKATVSFAMSVCPSVRMEQLGFY
jgi:hypothetical protein